MVLQRYALRFTISDATLDSLKLPRSTSQPKQDPDQAVEEHTTSPIKDSEETQQHTAEPSVPQDQKPEKPEELDIDAAGQQECSPSVSSSSPTPVSPLSPVTNSENVPAQSQQISNQPQSEPAEPPTTPQKQPVSEDAKPQNKHSPPGCAQTEPHATQPAHTLPSPPAASPRPVPLLAAKPYCQPRSSQAGHKPVKVKQPC